jgi:hypothetical protein
MAQLGSEDNSSWHRRISFNLNMSVARHAHWQQIPRRLPTPRRSPAAGPASGRSWSRGGGGCEPLRSRLRLSASDSEVGRGGGGCASLGVTVGTRREESEEVRAEIRSGDSGGEIRPGGEIRRRFGRRFGAVIRAERFGPGRRFGWRFGWRFGRRFGRRDSERRDSSGEIRAVPSPRRLSRGTGSRGAGPCSRGRGPRPCTGPGPGPCATPAPASPAAAPGR